MLQQNEAGKPQFNSGFFVGVLKRRGVPAPDQELLRSAVSAMDGALVNALWDRALKMGNGGDNPADFEFLAVTGRCLSQEIYYELVGCGIETSPKHVLEWCLLNSDGVENIRKAIKGDQEVQAVLREKLYSPASGVKDPEEIQSTADAEDQAGDGGASDGKPKGAQSKAAQQKLGSFVENIENRSHHVYGKGAALTFEIDIARANEGTSRQYTLRIEGAKALAGEGYNWAEKIIFQFTRRELPHVAGVLLGLCESCAFKGHGQAKEKWCELKAQAGGIYVKVGQGKNVVNVPITKDDLYDLGVLAFRTLCLNDPGVDQNVLMNILRLSCRTSNRVDAG